MTVVASNVSWYLGCVSGCPEDDAVCIQCRCCPSPEVYDAAQAGRPRDSMVFGPPAQSSPFVVVYGDDYEVQRVIRKRRVSASSLFVGCATGGPDCCHSSCYPRPDERYDVEDVPLPSRRQRKSPVMTEGRTNVHQLHQKSSDSLTICFERHRAQHRPLEVLQELPEGDSYGRARGSGDTTESWQGSTPFDTPRSSCGMDETFQGAAGSQTTQGFSTSRMDETIQGAIASQTTQRLGAGRIDETFQGATGSQTTQGPSTGQMDETWQGVVVNPSAETYDRRNADRTDKAWKETVARPPPATYDTRNDSPMNEMPMGTVVSPSAEIWARYTTTGRFGETYDRFSAGKTHETWQGADVSPPAETDDRWSPYQMVETCPRVDETQGGTVVSPPCETYDRWSPYRMAETYHSPTVDETQGGTVVSPRAVTYGKYCTCHQTAPLAIPPTRIWDRRGSGLTHETWQDRATVSPLAERYDRYSSDPTVETYYSQNWQGTENRQPAETYTTQHTDPTVEIYNDQSIGRPYRTWQGVDYSQPVESYNRFSTDSFLEAYDRHRTGRMYQTWEGVSVSPPAETYDVYSRDPMLEAYYRHSAGQMDETWQGAVGSPPAETYYGPNTEPVVEMYNIHSTSHMYETPRGTFVNTQAQTYNTRQSTDPMSGTNRMNEPWHGPLLSPPTDSRDRSAEPAYYHHYY
ncbi:hypothetical protein BaRGS_00029578 [Batillaria attramentaria]|uniref:Uncharacterized protein n=1 Tax=Batillaria attramentaria TaxID=370345 RepID=A0ABD0JVM6_9CAEN